MSGSSNLRNSIGYLFLVLAPTTVGISIVGAKYLLASMPILFLLASRFFLATMLLWLLHVAIPNGHSKKILPYLKQLTRKDWFFLIAQALSAGVLFNFFMMWGLQYTNAHDAGIITSALPAIIVIVSCLVLRERFTAKKAICVVLATIGLVVVNMNGSSDGHSPASLLGNAIVFLSLLPEAAYYVLTKAYPSRLPLFLMAAVISAVNTLVLLPFLFYGMDWQALSFPLFDWSILVLVGFCSGLFYVFWYLGSTRVDAVMAGLSTAIMPVATVTVAWLALGEHVGLVQILGMGLVMASILAYALNKSPE